MFKNKDKTKRVAKFGKVSRGQFEKDYLSIFQYRTHNDSDEAYNVITLPKRSTTNSAGYDFVSPINFVLKPGETIKIPTGIRCEINSNYVLMIYVRSSVGFKYQTVLTNGTGIIDADYFMANNEGHIMIKLRNDGDKDLIVYAGERLVQGVFLPYGITVDDDARYERSGGIGSTGK